MSQGEILVVDDEEVMRDVLGRVLGQAGYAVSLAETGPQGLELARKGNYAAAIVDVMLPEMGGSRSSRSSRRRTPRWWSS